MQTTQKTRKAGTRTKLMPHGVRLVTIRFFSSISRKSSGRVLSAAMHGTVALYAAVKREPNTGVVLSAIADTSG